MDFYCAQVGFRVEWRRCRCDVHGMASEWGPIPVCGWVGLLNENWIRNEWCKKNHLPRIPQLIDAERSTGWRITLDANETLKLFPSTGNPPKHSAVDDVLQFFSVRFFSVFLCVTFTRLLFLYGGLSRILRFNYRDISFIKYSHRVPSIYGNVQLLWLNELSAQQAERWKEKANL